MHGNDTPKRRRRPLADRLWEKIDRRGPDECWLWLAGINEHGYGTISGGPENPRPKLSHRVAYELTYGPIPPGHVIGHSCDAPRCCNPAHLAAIGQSANMLQAWQRKTRSTVDVDYNPKPRPPKVERVCAKCNKTFWLTPSRAARNEQFCSRTCRDSGVRKPLADRFWPKVEKTDTCWLWTGAKTARGYGIIGPGGKGPPPVGAHVASWMIHFGEIPDGLSVLHKCDVRGCVRPDHLFLGTQADNLADASAKGRLVGNRGQFKGERHPQAKLTEADVQTIRQLYREGSPSPTTVAKRFGCSPGLIYAVVQRRAWKHVP